MKYGVYRVKGKDGKNYYFIFEKYLWESVEKIGYIKIAETDSYIETNNIMKKLSPLLNK